MENPRVKMSGLKKLAKPQAHIRQLRDQAYVNQIADTKTKDHFDLSLDRPADMAVGHILTMN